MIQLLKTEEKGFGNMLERIRQWLEEEIVLIKELLEDYDSKKFLRLTGLIVDFEWKGFTVLGLDVKKMNEALKEEGIPAEQLRRVHSPVGLDIGAVTPQEIAISILAEMIAVKYGKLTAEATQDQPTETQSLSWTQAAIGG